MYLNQKIASCCYCGNTTVLSLRGSARHELACASCGAPLRQMKSLKGREHTSAVDRSGLAGPTRKVKRREDARPRKSKKRKGSMHRLADIAEDLFDLFD